MTRPAKVLATTVVRGAEAGEAHGGLYLVDVDAGSSTLLMRADDAAISFDGRGGDRGLRGIAIAEDRIWVASSDALVELTRDYTLKGLHRCRYLRHAHEVHYRPPLLYIVSTAFDSVLAFDVRSRAFVWGLCVRGRFPRIAADVFDPRGEDGPQAGDSVHLNAIWASDHDDLWIGARSLRHLLHLESGELSLEHDIPWGTHNARPFGEGVICNDTQASRLAIFSAEELSWHAPRLPLESVQGLENSEPHIARPGFCRGLAVQEPWVFAGTSPACVARYNLEDPGQRDLVWLSDDVCVAVHGIAILDGSD